MELWRNRQGGACELTGALTASILFLCSVHSDMRNRTSPLWAEESVNTGRQKELDIARGLAVLFMVAVHVFETFADNAVVNSPAGNLIQFFGEAPAAPVFMFLLGVGIIYSKKSSASVLLKRGCLLVLLGYLLNVLRDTLPNVWAMVFHLQEGFPEDWKYEIVSVDILPFAGLALIFFSFVKKVRLRNWVLVALLAVFAVVNVLTRSIQVERYVPMALSGLVWGSSFISYFPFLSWILYPVAGYFFASLLIRCVNKPKLYFIMLISGFSVYVLMLFVNLDGLYFNGVFSEEYYHQGMLYGLKTLGFVIFWLGLLFFASKFFTGAAEKILTRWSRHVTPFYVIQWVLIGHLELLIDEQLASCFSVFVLILTVVALSDILLQLHAAQRQKGLAGMN